MSVSLKLKTRMRYKPRKVDRFHNVTTKTTWLMWSYFCRCMKWRVWGRSKFIFWPSVVQAAAPILWKSVFNTTTIPGNIISSLKFKMYIAYNNNKSVYKFMCLYTISSTRKTKKTVLKSQLPRGSGVVNLFSHFFIFHFIYIYYF